MTMSSTEGAAHGAFISVLHLDGGRAWAGGQNQVRLLMRELAERGIDQLCVCPAGSPLEERLREESLPVRGIRWRGGSDPRAMVSIARIARRFDIVHGHDAHALQVAILPTRLRRVPLVAARRVHFRASAWKWNRPDRVIAISDTVRDALLRGGIDRDRIRSIHSGVDVAELAAQEPLAPSLRERLGLGADDFLVGNIGHLHPYKGQLVIPAAAALLPDVHWVIIGEGPERAALEAAIARHGVGDRVHLTGFLPDARRVLGEFDAFVFSSTNEPLGTSVLDAMAREIPVIGADAAGSREILSPVHRATGISLFPAGDAAGLAERVRTLLREPERRPGILESQRLRLMDYRSERTAEQTLHLYQELIDEIAASPRARRPLRPWWGHRRPRRARVKEAR